MDVVNNPETPRSSFNVRGRNFNTQTFTNDNDANAFMMKNPGWGVIGEDPDGTIHVARMDDKGTNNFQGNQDDVFGRVDPLDVIDIVSRLVETKKITTDELATLKKVGITESDLSLSKKSIVESKKQVEPLVLIDIVSRLVETKKITTGELATLKRAGITESDLSLSKKSIIESRASEVEPLELIDIAFKLIETKKISKKDLATINKAGITESDWCLTRKTKINESKKETAALTELKKNVAKLLVR
jgi:hypothetical protein